MCYLREDVLILTRGVYIFMGGLMMFIGGILEWIIGNTFSALVFTTFGGFWFAYATTFIPNFGAFSFYAVQGSPAITGVDTRGFNATFCKNSLKPQGRRIY